MYVAPTTIEDRLKQASGKLTAGAVEQARALYADVLKDAPHHPMALAQLGLIALRGGDAQTAVSYLEGAVRAAPLSSVLHANLATALVGLGRLASANTTAKRTLILNPGDVGAATALAERLMSMGQPEDAARLFARVARLRLTEPSLWFNLGVARVAAGDLTGAAEAYRRNARLLHGRALTDHGPDPDPDLPTEPVKPIPRLSCWHRLAHDRAQLQHLRDRGLLPPELADEPDRYARVIDGLSAEERRAATFDLDDARYATLARSYGRIVHLASTGWDDAPVLNETIDWAGRERAFLDGDPRAITIDDMLTPTALTALRRFCWDSTIWHQIKAAGYLGAYFREGFGDPLVVRIAEELQERMPAAFGGLAIKVIWGYSYEQSMAGINPHADFARINLNFWITPDDANLDPETGGLIVYRKAAPPDWDFRTYNTASADFIYDYLGARRADFIRVPHRANRAVVFDSRLIHETDRFSFAPGHTNRRINITLLFGDGG
ncbi:MAG: tetratricopeptide repeat protein [Thalassobaculaceae bacterium]|nr:tetratricopeptide repeat protein [Thalassobaculaceae bacterium]